MDSTRDARRAQAGPVAEQKILDALRKGFETRDAALLASLYADDAEVTICNRNFPPTKPLVLRGRDAVQRMYEDMCGREMTHRLGEATVGDGSIAFAAHCRYPDGCQVVGMYQATVRGERIVRELSVDCWDE